jgi:hypothetical protein
VNLSRMMRAAIAAVLIAGAAALVSPSAASAQEGPPAVFVMTARSSLDLTGRLPWGCTLTPFGDRNFSGWIEDNQSLTKSYGAHCGPIIVLVKATVRDHSPGVEVRPTRLEFRTETVILNNLETVCAQRQNSIIFSDASRGIRSKVLEYSVSGCGVTVSAFNDLWYSCAVGLPSTIDRCGGI